MIKTRLLLLYNISCTLHQNVLKNGNTISLGRAFVCSEETPIAIMALRQSTALLKALQTVNSELRLLVFNKVVNIVLVLSAVAIELKSFLKFDGHFETNLTKNFIIHVLVIYLKTFFKKGKSFPYFLISFYNIHCRLSTPSLNAEFQLSGSFVVPLNNFSQVFYE